MRDSEQPQSAAAAIEALRASEELKTRIIESSRDCIKVLDLEGRLLSMNAGGMATLEICDLGPFLNTFWVDFWQGEDRRRAQDAVDSARAGGTGRFVGFFATVEKHTSLWFDVVVTPLRDSSGRPERLLASSRDITAIKLAEEGLRRSQEELEQKVADRTAALQREVQDRLEGEAALRAVVQGVESETGSSFFASLVRHLAAALRVPYVFVSELLIQKGTFHSRAVWGRGTWLNNFEVPLRGTPCESVLAGETSHFPDSLQRRFPKDLGLVTWGVESYCGVPLINRSGTVTGHIAVFDDKPMLDASRTIAILRIFAARAQAEVERIVAEEALGVSEASYRDLYDEAPIAYMSVGTDGRIRRANRCAAEMFGYPLEQLIGSMALNLPADTPFGKPRSRTAFERFLKGLDTIDEEIECRRSNGEPLWVRLSVSPMRDAEGRIEATRSMLVNITDRKRAEAALAESEERLSQVIDSAMDAIVTIDAERRIVLFNDAAEKVFRCPANVAIGATLDRFLTSGFQRALQKSLSAFDIAGPTRPYVWAPDGVAARRADGEEFPVEATLSFVEVGGRRLYTLILRDIDERRRAEEGLRQLSLQNEYLQEEIRAAHSADEIVGSQRGMRDVLEKVALVAPTDSSVLILGETGTGKEVVARAIHSSGKRAARPLIKVNCAALPSGLIESELFGHEKGAFTGATDRRIGRFELADRGTIFLDEVGELPLDVQVKLLRVLQEQEFERVGGSKTIAVDVRVIAATNRDLAGAIADGSFRTDLYYRLNVFPISLPPLRQRGEDIPLLVHYFAERFAARMGRRTLRIHAEDMARLVNYSWPGNVRELENVIERAIILSTGPEFRVPPAMLAAPVPAPAAAKAAMPPVAPSPATAVAPGSLVDVEREHILTVLQQTNWRIDGPRGAATILNLNPSTLRSRLKKLAIQRDR